MIHSNCGIYKITNPFGKVYIGQAVDIKRRKIEYNNLERIKRQPRIYNSLKKYGWKNHQFDIIEYCTEEELNCSERFWQDEFDVTVNCVLQECGAKRREYTEEVKKNKSKSQTGNKNPFYGKNHTEESKLLIVKNRKVFVHTDESRRVASEKTRMGNNPRAKKVENPDTKKIYDCIKEAAIANNIKSELLERYLNGTIENKTNLQYLDINLRPKSKKYSYKNLLYLDISVGVYYYSLIEASAYLGIHKNKLSLMLNGHIENITNLIKC